MHISGISDDKGNALDLRFCGCRQKGHCKEIGKETYRLKSPNIVHAYRSTISLRWDCLADESGASRFYMRQGRHT